MCPSSTSRASPLGLRRASSLVLVLAVVSVTVLVWPRPSSAQECGSSAIASIYGTGSVATVTAQSRAGCQHGQTAPVEVQPQPYFTHEVACSPNRRQAAAGLCSATPCSRQGRFFAFRTRHQPDGTSTPAGFRCVTLDQATAAPGITAAQLFAALRRVRLPGGRITATPHHQGLANLPTYFHLHGARQPPVDLQVGTATVHARFHPVAYRWAFGDGQRLATTGPGRRGVGSEVRVAYPRRGRYQVRVQVAWVAEAFLDGRRVGRVDDLASQAQATYPVAEVRAVLTG